LEPSWVCALKSLQLPPEKRGEELDGTGSVASTAPHPEEDYGDTVDGRNPAPPWMVETL